MSKAAPVRIFGLMGFAKYGGEFKVDDAKTAVGLAVGDVAHVRVIVTDAEGLELGKQLTGTLRIEMLNPASAVARDDAKVLLAGFKQAGHEVAAARFEQAQHFHLVNESRVSFGSMIDFDYLPVVGKSDGCPERVFDCKWHQVMRAISRQPGASYIAVPFANSMEVWRSLFVGFPRGKNGRVACPIKHPKIPRRKADWWQNPDTG